MRAGGERLRKKGHAKSKDREGKKKAECVSGKGINDEANPDTEIKKTRAPCTTRCN